MLFKASDVNEKINDYVKKNLNKFNEIPCLFTIRVGNNSSDISYEKGINKKFDLLGLKVINKVLDENINQIDLINEIKKISNDENINGILLFSGLNSNINYDEVKEYIDYKKDIEGITNKNISNLFLNISDFTYCAPMAVMECLDYYNIDLTGKNVVILGRGKTVGKPLAMLMLKKNATVTICHSKTKNLIDITKKADILVSAIGKKHFINENFVNENQILIDVGTTYENNKLYGDVDPKLENKVKAMTPTPNGISSMTTSILAKNLIELYKKQVN